MVPSQLLSPLSVGDLNLSNRVVMAPMTRSRADQETEAVSELHVKYYAQRANAGLIITEGVHPSRDGKGYNRTPGIYTPSQIEAWSQVTRAVHDAGGLIACQLMHCGRIGHPLNAPGSRFVAPSPIPARAEIFTPAGMQPMPTPEALTVSGIAEVVNHYRTAAENCLAAGFDAVELHCASGYLPAQFLATGSNLRSDGYGGELANRLRFVREVLEALVTAVGPGRVGMRISPGNTYNDHLDDDPVSTYTGVLSVAEALGLAWVHTIRMPATGIDSLALSRQHFSGTLLGNESFAPAEAEAAIGTGVVDAVSFGRLYIANPDLVPRLAAGREDFNALDKKTIYAGEGTRGFTDYPTLEEQAAGQA